MSRRELYDTIGATYTATRRTEPRIAAREKRQLNASAKRICLVRVETPMKLERNEVGLDPWGPFPTSEIMLAGR